MANEKRLIDADALLQTMESNLYWGLDSDGAILDTIDEAPTVDAAEVVHGRWKAHKPDSRGYANGFICSCCGNIVYTDYSMKECVYNYCPNCGAKMDGGESSV